MSEPEPDVLVLRREHAALSWKLQPEDISLLVEIADSTLQYDLTVKARLYARAGIIEYWVLDLKDRRVVVHRDPIARNYSSAIGYGEHETLAPLAAPDAQFSPRLVLPPLS